MGGILSWQEGSCSGFWDAIVLELQGQSTSNAVLTVVVVGIDGGLYLQYFNQFIECFSLTSAIFFFLALCQLGNEAVRQAWDINAYF